MKFCKFCGNQIDENAIFCPKCGSRVNGESSNPYGGQNTSYNPYGGFGYQNPYPVYDTAGSKAVAVLSFIFWQAGLILWFFWRRSRPGKARSAAKGTLANVCVSLPVFGAAVWLLWKDDFDKKDFAKVAGISAIVGAVIYAITIIAVVILYATGVVDAGYNFSLPYGEMMAYISTFR